MSKQEKIAHVMAGQWLRPYEIIDKLMAIGEKIQSESSITAELRRMRNRKDKWHVPPSRKCSKGSQVNEYQVLPI